MKINPNIKQSISLSESSNLRNLEKKDLSEILSFENTLKDAQVMSTQCVIQELIQKFERQEKIVMRNPTITNIKEYTGIIKEMLSIASNNYKCDEINIYSGSGLSKNLNLTSIIDEKLNNIIEDFMSTNKLSLESLSDMEDIKGLILNVLV